VIPFEEWIDLEVETPSYDPSLWLLASEGREAVGALSCVVSGDRGWVGELGVRCPGADAGSPPRCCIGRSPPSRPGVYVG
jgi:hypothetical protein